MLNIDDYGVCPDTRGLPGIPARVTAQYKQCYEVVCKHGAVYAQLKTGNYYAGEELIPTVGDFVMLRFVTNGDSLITATLPRRTFFARKEPGPVPKMQAVAANFDDVFIMQSMNMDFNPKRLERYLTLAWQSGARPVILLTKADLVEEKMEYLT